MLKADPATAARLSKQVGAEFFFTGKLHAVDERQDDERRVQYFMFIQVLDVETGEILFQHNCERVRLRNISEHGAMVDCTRAIAEGAEILACDPDQAGIGPLQPGQAPVQRVLGREEPFGLGVVPGPDGRVDSVLVFEDATGRRVGVTVPLTVDVKK